MSAADFATKTSSSAVHSSSDVSIRILEALCLEDGFEVLRETLKLYRQEVSAGTGASAEGTLLA